MAAMLLPLSLQTLASGVDSSGGIKNPAHFLQDPDSIFTWFLGNDPVKYCIKRNSNFLYSQDQLNDMIQEAVKQWKNYIAASDESNGGFPDGPSGFQMAGSSDLFQTDFNFQFTPICQGNEDIIFYFGIVDSHAAAILGSDLEDISAAIRESYNELTGRARGVVYFAPNNAKSKGHSLSKDELPDWRFEPNLYGALLHELGHVFGGSHMSGTIMDADLGSAQGDYLRSPRNFAAMTKAMHSIDGTVTYLSQNQDQVIGKTPIPMAMDEFTNFDSKKWEVDTGVHFVCDKSPCKVSIRLVAGSLTSPPDYRTYYSLDISTDKGILSFPITAKNSSIETINADGIKKIRFMPRPWHWSKNPNDDIWNGKEGALLPAGYFTVTMMSSLAHTETANLTTPDGRKIALDLRLNDPSKGSRVDLNSVCPDFDYGTSTSAAQCPQIEQMFSEDPFHRENDFGR